MKTRQGEGETRRKSESTGPPPTPYDLSPCLRVSVSPCLRVSVSPCLPIPAPSPTIEYDVGRSPTPPQRPFAGNAAGGVGGADGRAAGAGRRRRHGRRAGGGRGGRAGAGGAVSRGDGP